MSNEANTLFPPLTALDRCDRCSAAALTRAAKFVGETDVLHLLFCGHHLKDVEAKLVEQGFEIFSES
jgi:hypothetical protein